MLSTATHSDSVKTVKKYFPVSQFNGIVVYHLLNISRVIKKCESAVRITRYTLLQIPKAINIIPTHVSPTTILTQNM
jgi:hypothetical protein